ncbi:murein biosynthesis integral membrane protein MurJ [soil metagenome]
MTHGALARAGLVVMGAFLASRVLGGLRVVVLGNQFGDAPAELDAYFAAFRIPDLIFQLVAAGAVASALVPILSGIIASGEHARAWRVVSTVTNLMIGSLLVLAILMAVSAPAIVPLLVPGFDADTTALTVELTRLMLIAPVFLAAGAIASAVLNTEGRFGAAALAPVMYNAAIIGGALLLGPGMGVHGAAVGVVVGAILHLAIQLPALRGHLRYAPRVHLEDEAARRSFWLMLPRAVGMGANQITFLINTLLASTVAVGAVVSYNVAFSVLQIPLGVVGLPLGIVLLPSLSRAMASGQDVEFGRLVVGSLRLLLWATVFLAAVGIVVRDEVVTLLFGWSFDAATLASTAATLGVFLVGLPAHALNVILARAFYSGQDTATPVTIAVAAVAVNVVISLLTIERLGLQGLALGIAVGAWFEAITLTLLLRRRSTALSVGAVARGGAASLGGALLSAVAAAVVLAALPVASLGGGASGLAIQLTLVALSSGGCYLLYSRLMRLPELPRTLGLLRSALRPG